MIEKVIILDHVTKIYKLFSNEKKRFLATLLEPRMFSHYELS